MCEDGGVEQMKGDVEVVVIVEDLLKSYPSEHAGITSSSQALAESLRLSQPLSQNPCQL